MYYAISVSMHVIPIIQRESSDSNSLYASLYVTMIGSCAVTVPGLGSTRRKIKSKGNVMGQRV